MKSWRFLVIFMVFFGCLLLGLLIQGEAQSQRARISVTFLGQYRSTSDGGRFEVVSSGQKICVTFNHRTLSIFSANKLIKGYRAYADTYLRERLVKGKKIDLEGNWYNWDKKTNIFRADDIYLHLE